MFAFVIDVLPCDTRFKMKTIEDKHGRVLKTLYLVGKYCFFTDPEEDKRSKAQTTLESIHETNEDTEDDGDGIYPFPSFTKPFSTTKLTYTLSPFYCVRSEHQIKASLNADIAKNNFSGIDISQGLDLKPPSMSP